MMTTTPTLLSTSRSAIASAFSALMLLAATTLHAQVTGLEQDCFNALPVCNGVYTQTRSYTGEGSVNDEIPDGSCLLDGEKNDVWYIFTVRTTGDLSFTITPLGPTDDYDWAVYNLTNAGCADIRSGAIAPTSCNYSNTAGLTGATTATGANSQPKTGTPFNRVIPVVAGQTYVLNVSKWTDATLGGYRLDFTNSTAEVFDQVAPAFVSATLPSACEDDQVIATFSENIKCSSVQPDDFELTGPGGPYVIIDVASAACASGGGFDDSFTLTTSPALAVGGTYTLTYSGSVADVCDNRGTLASRTFTASPVPIPTITIDGPTTLCSCQELILTAPAGFDGYRWSNGETTRSINVKETGAYSVRVMNGGCLSRPSNDVRVTRVDAESTIDLPQEAVHGSPGDTVVVPIDISSSRFLDFCGARNYTVRLSYNHNLLKALDGNVVATSGDIATLELKGTRGDTVGSLARPRFLAMLGNAENTPIVVESAGWDECATLTLSNGGGFQLDNLCREGGTRLFRSGPPASLKPLRPSPVRESVRIDFSLGVDCRVRISMVDLKGNEVAVVLDGDRPAGSGNVLADLSTLTPGLYICTLSAQGETHTQMVEVVR